MGGDVGLGLHVYILRSIESGWAARPHPIRSQSLNCLLLKRLVRDKVVEVIGRQVDNGLAIRELGLWARSTANVLSAQLDHVRPRGLLTRR